MTAAPVRFTTPLLRGVQFERRPVADPPEDGTVCFVDSGDVHGWRDGQSVAVFRDGAWVNGRGRRLPFEPTFWTTIKKTTDEV